MRDSVFFFTFLCFLTATSQNISVDSQSHTPQQLIEDILIDSNCIANVQVTNTVGGDFNGADQSYGFFDASGTSFPFQSGIVLSTGRLANVQGPNTTLSDDDAPNWSGDGDLETVLQENNTLNATILEFDFTSIASEVSFRYIFASEEYQEGNPNTCQFSDLFGFLIRPITDTTYENIALVPNTSIPVKVTTVHPEIPNACEAENEIYFESFNGNVSPINFNGQTKILTATASIIPNETYHVKLVIADEQNFRFDSAVFLEAGSFQLNTNLGPDRLFENQNPVCQNDTITLNASQPGMTTYKWFKDGIELATETNATLLVAQAGIYNVEITLDNGCISYGEIIIEYAQNPTVFNTTLIACDVDLDGFTTYNLFDATQDIINGDNNLSISNFYNTLADAEMSNNEIAQPNSYNNTGISEIVYANVISQLSGCSSIAEVTLDISTNTLLLQDVDSCDGDVVDGFASFDLNDIITQITPLVPTNSNIYFFQTLDDAFSNTNILTGNYTNMLPDSEDIFVKVTTETNQCHAISPLTLNVLPSPELLEDESILYCLNTFPETQTLQAGVLNDSPANYSYQWLLNGVDTGVTSSFIDINEIGTYAVVVTLENGCSNMREITVVASEAPTVENLDYTELTSNNVATISVSGIGDYEYAIDDENGSYQDENTFNYLTPGFHTIYIRDKLGCGNAFISFSIIGFPQYFTPNGDNVHDTWKPYGINQQFNSQLKIQIFNRYGKLIRSINPLLGWNGTLDGKILPSDDYWFLLTHTNGKEYRGHFALIR